MSLHICAAGSADGLLYTASLLDCYSLCQAQPGVRVVSNSYQSDCQGTPCYSQLEFDAIQALGAAGALFVVAAGNSACMHACCDAR